MFSFPLLLAAYTGFTHAFEADHLLAVSNIVSARNNARSSIKDGLYWGLGHGSTIVFIGILSLFLRTAIASTSFRYFEATVGIMLIILAIYRLIRFFRIKDQSGFVQAREPGENGYTHLHGSVSVRRHKHSLAYFVGMVHGLAGSGALILVVITQMQSPGNALIYLLIFAGGCIAGMFLAAALFSIPFSGRMIRQRVLQSCLVLTSSVMCLLYGSKVIIDNLVW